MPEEQQPAEQHRAAETVRVACIQMHPEIGELERNVARSLELCAEAADAGATLLVLPELCSSGYVFETRSEAWNAAEEVPAGPTATAWSEFCRERGVYLVAGIAERAVSQPPNTSATPCVPAGNRGTLCSASGLTDWARLGRASSTP